VPILKDNALSYIKSHYQVQQYLYPIGRNKKTKAKSSIESAKPWRRHKTQEQEMCYVGRPIDGYCNSFIIIA